MSEDGRTLASYLLSSPHSNMLGCFRIPHAYVADDLKWSSERVSKGFGELFRKGWATVPEGSNWVVIHKFLKWNQPENPNVVKAAEKLFDQIPDDCGVKPLLARAIAEFEPRFSAQKLEKFEPFPKGIERVSKAYRKPEPEPEPEPNQKEDADASPPNPSDPKAMIFTLGVKILTGVGESERGARSFLGRFIKNDEAKLAEVIGYLAANPKVEPKAYIAAAMTPKRPELVL